jgi:WD40 repeat protein
MPRPERALDPSDGPVQRLAAELRELRRRAGGPGYRELALRAGYSATTLSEAAGGRRLPMLPVVLAYARACGDEPAGWETRWRAAAAELAAARDGRPATDDDAPYRGLASFRAEDAGRFFGRERLVEELLARLDGSRLAALVGASGSGKSSLLHAGLVPACAGRGWRPVPLTPGAHPAAGYRSRLSGRAAAGEPGEPLVVVDQFEELFTLCGDEDERRRFVDDLLAATAGEEPRTRVVLGVRADFYADCARFPRLARALTGATVLIGPMSDEELRRAVVGPAHLAGLTVERALAVRVLADAAGQPGALPLVSHALLETWRQRQGPILTVAGYQATGGVSGAIARTAERVYGQFDAHQRLVARQVLVRLTALGEGTADTRRRVDRAELDFQDADVVIDRLVRARLLVVNDQAVEIAHEALIGAWPRLRGWLTDDRQALRVHRQLTEAAAVWESLGRDDGSLYRGARLAPARELAERGDDRTVLTAAERSFLDASIAAERAERAAARRRARQLRGLTAALALLLVLAVGAATVAARQWGNAVGQRQQALSRQLASEAVALGPTDVQEAMRRALAGWRAAPTVEARGALLSLASRPPYSGRLPHAGMVKDVAFNADGTLLATAGQDGTIIVWDVARRAERARLAGHEDPVRSVAFSPDGTLLASGGLGGNVVLWDVRAGTVLARLPGGHRARVGGVAFSPDGAVVASIGEDERILLWRVSSRAPLGELAGHGGNVSDLAFAPDGQVLASAGDDGAVAVWDVRRRARTATLRTGPLELYAVAFHPDGRHLAAAGADRDITVWDVATGRRVALLQGHTGQVRSLAFAPDGATLVSAGHEPFVVVWDVEDLGDAKRFRRVVDRTGHTSELFGVAVSPDGRTIASAGRDRAVLLWDLAELPMAGHVDELTSVAVSPDGRRLVSASLDRTAVVWDTADRAALPPPLGHTEAVTAVAFSPDGRRIASGNADRRARIWDAGTHALLHTLTGHADRVTSVAFHPDGRLLATTGGLDHTVRLWDAGSGRPLAVLRHPDQVQDAIFSRDGGTLVSASQDGTVIVWDTATRARRAVVAAGTGLLEIALSPDGGRLAVGGAEGTVTLWDLDRPTPVAVLRGHSGPVPAVAFSPDGRLLASGGLDQAVVLWDLAGRRPWARLTGHGGGVAAVAWRGRLLYSGGVDHTVTPWTVDPSDAQARICRRLRHGFADATAAGCRP